jgi:hypothetical protein
MIQNAMLHAVSEKRHDIKIHRNYYLMCCSAWVLNLCLKLGVKAFIEYAKSSDEGNVSTKEREVTREQEIT